MVYLKRRLAAFIKEKRGSKSQKEFAKRIGVAQSSIMRIEHEDQNVTLKTLEQLCKVYNCDIKDLFPPQDRQASIVVGVKESRSTGLLTKKNKSFK